MEQVLADSIVVFTRGAVLVSHERVVYMRALGKDSEASG